MNEFLGKNNLHQFDCCLDLTKVWCAENFSSRHLHGSLRPEILEPKVDVRDFNVSALSKVEEMVRLNTLKSKLIKNLENPEKIKGRILLYYPYLSMCDGFVGVESMGFMDSDEMPPWGSWFFYKHGASSHDSVLFSWIPLDACGLVEKAILVDQYDCLKWMSNT